MNKKGFTLVELLAVVIIIALIIGIAIPSTQAVSGKIKDRMYNTKMELANKAAILWAQDKQHKKCLVTSSVPLNCPNPSNLSCKALSGGELKCSITLGQLADDELLQYDDGNNIINPINKESMNNTKVCIKYNNNNNIIDTIAC